MNNRIVEIVAIVEGPTEQLFIRDINVRSSMSGFQKLNFFYNERLCSTSPQEIKEQTIVPE
jgi:hypothetical protein